MKYIVQNIFLFIFFFFFLFFTSCNINESKNKENFFDSVNVKLQDTINSDDTTNIVQDSEVEVYEIKDKSVTFFMPNYKEKKEIVKHYGIHTQYDFQHLYDNFTHLSDYSNRNLKKYNINTTTSTAYEFHIHKNNDSIIVFNKIIEDEIIGMILYDGKNKHYITYGLYSNRDFNKLIETFFKISD